MVEAIMFKKSSQVVSFNITQLLTQTGLQVQQSFNLNDVKLLDPNYECPYHTNIPCDCEYNVLLIYSKDAHAPVTLLISGHSESCSIHVVNNANNQALYQEIQDILNWLIDPNTNLLI